jgi:hypothetical protein
MPVVRIGRIIRAFVAPADQAPAQISASVHYSEVALFQPGHVTVMRQLLRGVRLDPQPRANHNLCQVIVVIHDELLLSNLHLHSPLPHTPTI